MTMLVRIGNETHGAFGVPVVCPHPECMHVGAFITKAHVKMAHGVTRDELYAKHGAPFKMVGDNFKPHDGRQVFEWGEVKSV